VLHAQQQQGTHLLQARDCHGVVCGLQVAAHGDVELEAEFVARHAIPLVGQEVHDDAALVLVARVFNYADGFVERQVIVLGLQGHVCARSAA